MSKGKVGSNFNWYFFFYPCRYKLFKTYCQMMLGQSEKKTGSLKGILQGEIRVLTANLTIEDVFWSKVS